MPQSKRWASNGCKVWQNDGRQHMEIKRITGCGRRQTRTEATVRQHFTWNNLRKDAEQVCKKYHTCQLTKKIDPKIGHLLAKTVEEGTWDTLCVD
eukprot:7219693-Ditylum_brightwellii.AAC.1